MMADNTGTVYAIITPRQRAHIDGTLPASAVSGSASRPPHGNPPSCIGSNATTKSFARHIACNELRSSKIPSSGPSSGPGPGLGPGLSLATPTALAAAQPNDPDVAAFAATNLQPLPQGRTLRRRARLARRINHPNAAAVRAAHELRWLKQTVIDRFAAWHLGRDYWCGWDGDRRLPAIARIPIPPNRGAWPGHLRPVRAVGNGMHRLPQLKRMGSPRGLHRVIGRMKPRAPTTSRAVAGALQRQIAAEFKPAGWKFKRMLGMGGYGAVFLLEMVGENGLKIPVVVKGSIKAGRGLYHEFENVVASAWFPLFIHP